MERDLLTVLRNLANAANWQGYDTVRDETYACLDRMDADVEANQRAQHDADRVDADRVDPVDPDHATVTEVNDNLRALRAAGQHDDAESVLRRERAGQNRRGIVQPVR